MHIGRPITTRGGSREGMPACEGCDAGVDEAARLSDCRPSTRAQLSPEPPHTPHSSTTYPACRMHEINVSGKHMSGRLQGQDRSQK